MGHSPFHVRSNTSRRHGSNGQFLNAQQPIDFTIDLLMLAVMAVVPLVMGGRGDVGKAVMVALIVLATIAYSVRQLLAGGLRWNWTATEPLLLLGLAIGTLQMLPLDAQTLAKLSPESVRLLTGRESLGLASWTTLSLNPYDTRGSVAVYIAYVLYFYLLVHRIRSLQDVGRILRSVAVITTGMAVVGLAQRFAGNGHFLWVYQHPSRDTFGSVKGTFANPNHFAHFMALGVGCLIWWWLDGSESRANGNAPRLADSGLHRKLLPCAIALVLFACLLSFSRGGCVVLAGTLAVSAAMWWGIGRLNWRVVATIAVIGLPASLGLAIYGAGPLAEELGSLHELNDVEQVSNGRQALWSALREGGEAFLWTGSGLGTHRFIYPVYMEEHFEFSFSHGESSYLQLFIEAGLPAIVLMLFAITLTLRKLAEAYRGRRTASCYAAAIAPAVFASLFHSFFDFVWYISGCMVIVIALLACLIRVVQIEREASGDSPSSSEFRPNRSPKVAAWVLAGLATLLGALLLKDRLPRALAAPHWDRFLQQSLAVTGDESADEQRVQFAAMYRSLATAIAKDPYNPRFRGRLATVSLKRFELEQEFADNSMTLGQIRQAAELSNFEDSSALQDWVERAFGEKAKLLYIAREQAGLSASRAPLMGNSYLHLAELDFLDPTGESREDQYIRFAAQVRPFDSGVRFALGGVFARHGQLGTAIAHWKAAFRREKETRLRIIQSVGPQVPAHLFIHMFGPETPDLGRLLVLYRELDRAADANYVANKYALSLENDARKQTGKAAANIWWIAQSVYGQLGNRTRQLHAVTQAVNCQPNDIPKRKTLATLYFAQEQYAQAMAECQWCLKRDPKDENIRRLAREASLRQTSQRDPSPIQMSQQTFDGTRATGHEDRPRDRERNTTESAETRIR